MKALKVVPGRDDFLDGRPVTLRYARIAVLFACRNSGSPIGRFPPIFCTRSFVPANTPFWWSFAISSKCCHSVSDGVSSLMLDRALDAIVRRVKKLDHDHDIPYLAGYSEDGKTIYIDRHMPRTMKFRGREIDSDRFLILHEEVEKTLIDQLGLHYRHAHQIATRAEEAAVRAAGLVWRDYDRSPGTRRAVGAAVRAPQCLGTRPPASSTAARVPRVATPPPRRRAG
jgi:hypothetical protein